MQRAERRDVPQNGHSLVKGSLIVLALALAGGAFLLLTKNDPKPIPMDKPPSGDVIQPLTDSEARSIFQRLDRGLNLIYLHGDSAETSRVLASGSPAERRVESDLKKLHREGAIFHRNFVTRSLEVDSISTTRIEIIQVAVSRGRILNEAGENITGRREADLQTIQWTLVQDAGKWLIYDSLITDAQPLNDKGSA